jgi:predicted O-methyltransferase YrrM
MRTVDVSFRLLSEVVWQRVLEASAFELQSKRARFFETIGKLDELRKSAEYDTGSISASSCWLLYSLANFFRPTVTAEVGTFIGKSTISFALGLDEGKSQCEIHTCDASNAIDLPAITGTKIVQYKKVASTQMLAKLSGGGYAGKLDFLLVDGRLQSDDHPHLTKLLHKNSVLAFDDFEGIEKGVTNLTAFPSSEMLSSHTLVYPCSERLLAVHGFTDPSSLAFLMPGSLVRFTKQ